MSCGDPPREIQRNQPVAVRHDAHLAIRADGRLPRLRVDGRDIVHQDQPHLLLAALPDLLLPPALNQLQVSVGPRAPRARPHIKGLPLGLAKALARAIQRAEGQRG